MVTSHICFCWATMGTPKYIFFSLFFFFFKWPHLQHMEVPRLGVKLELQLPAYTTATAAGDLSPVCDYTPAHSHARSLTHWAGPRIKPTFMDNSQVCLCWAIVDNFFRSRFTANLRGRLRDFHYVSCPHTCIDCLTINIFHQDVYQSFKVEAKDVCLF